MKDNEIVKIYPNGGWHYHRMNCPWAKSPNYVSLPFSKVKKLKSSMTNRHYEPCGCISGRYPKDIIGNIERRSQK